MSDACCSAGDCPRAVYKAGFCAGHYRRKREGRPLTPLKTPQGGVLGAKDPHDRMKDACFTYEDALDSDDEQERERAWANLVDAAEWVALGVPKVPRLQRLGYRLLSEVRAKMKAALKGNQAPDAHADMHRVHR